MQSKLEVGRAGRHHKIIVPPSRLNLRRATSYQKDKAPLSATSSRFSFNHLFFSPPPSPSLPALVPRAKKSPARPLRPTRIFRLVAWVTGTLLIVYIAARIVRRHVDLRAVKVTYIAPKTEEFEMVRQEEGLPDFPTPIMAKDILGRSSWTVSIPRDRDFPLDVNEYAEMMDSCREVASAVHGLHDWSAGSGSQQSVESPHSGVDPYYVDVRHAEKAGLLPAAAELGAPSSRGNLVGVADDDPSMPECQRTLTAVLETSDAGLGNTLMMLWTFYGVAQEQGRAFFVDDSKWAYGRYVGMFRPPPTPPCRPPPRHEMVPCPTQADHLVVTGATARHALLDSLGRMGDGHSGAQAAEMGAESARDAESTRKTIFDLARKGYEALYHVIKEDADYVDRRVAELTSKAAAAAGPAGGVVPIAGVHIRRGDCRPLESPYRDSYIPNEVYAESARSAAGDGGGGSGSGSLLVVASDDPTIYAAEEFQGAHAAQERIKLASKEAAGAAHKERNRHVFHRFTPEAFGWEGGFFSAMFWNLGLPRGAARGHHEAARGAGKETVKLRGYLGRAYLLDLAVLARSGDVVVCGVGSMGCRLLGVMMGWEAVEGGRWVNVDGEHGWMGLTW